MEAEAERRPGRRRRRVTASGIIFMSASWGLVLFLAAYSFWKLFGGDE